MSSTGRIDRQRRYAEQANVYLRVQNTLARMAFEDTEFEYTSERLSGTLVLAFSRQELAAAARVVKDFTRSNNNLVVRFLSVDGKALEASDIDVLTSLPHDYADLDVPMLARMFDKRCRGYEAVGYSISLPTSAAPGWPAGVPLPVDGSWKHQYGASLRRLLRDSIRPPCPPGPIQG